MLKPILVAKTDPKANENQTVIIDGIRITYLTSRLIRVEKGNFTDLASYVVWFRNFTPGNMNVTRQNNAISVETDDVIFTIKKGKPYSVYFKDSKNTERFGAGKNLKGTRRTLDATFGRVGLDDGFITDNGVYLLDDSSSMLINEKGNFVPRENGSKDYYAFAYGNNYRETIKAFYKISSPTPLIPRYALGVWWSRYHAYSQQEYLDLMDKFKAEDIPLTVATVDMDWHWVKEKDIKGKFGAEYDGCGTYGWTGYSWNTDLFPDYKEFLSQLKKDNLHVTLNLHPADGVHSYENMYNDMAKATGVDPETKEKIKFRCGDDNFWNAYFDILHKPYEKDGVDFWWIDWQQGKKSDVKGLDPLNALNHYHYLDNAEDGRMPLILSRYAGFGSHRYPLGFSGDTAVNWKVFDFQPYFTANSANVGYTWWSHDIGGHHMGYRDDDLYIRWLQFGVFSPIMRLHSTSNELLRKEPWKYKTEVYRYAKEWLNLRHKLIPYIFTMDYRTHLDGIALCEPMYYSYPENKKAYCVPNQYMFGSKLMVCPITAPQHKELNMGSVKAWIPKGRWTDIFTNQSYDGEKTVTLFRDLDTIPVLAKEGAIIPLSADKGNSTSNPENLEIWAFSGNGAFTLVEDNSKTDYISHRALTEFKMEYADNRLTFTVEKAQGDLSVIPQRRNYKIIVKDLVADGKPVVIELDNASVNEAHSVTVENVSRVENEAPKDAVINIMSRWQTGTRRKSSYFKPFENLDTKAEIMSALKKSSMPEIIKEAIKEHIC
ncbi:MAG: glycoside hydrolase family 31 protein [Eubacteriales bacterium]|nr:glycoside hydrolase family 31 protein [Eubacteriales bacterium]